MIKLNWKSSLLCTLAAVVILFTACEKNDDLDTGHLEDQVQNFMGVVNDMGQESEMDSTVQEVLCFEFEFPISVLWPEGNTVVFNNEDTLWAAVDLWYEINPDSEEDPEIVFPITVIFEDGTTEVIEDDEDLCDLYYDCYEEWEDEEDWEDDEEEEWEEECPEELLDACFDIVFPIEIDIDGTRYSVNSLEEADSLVYSSIDTTTMSVDYDIELVYPIEIILDDSLATQLTIEDDEALEEQLEICYDEWDDDELCFEVHYPITLVFPDNTTVVVNSDDEVEDAIDAYEDKYPDFDGDIYPEFPITVTLDDNTQQTIENAEQLDNLFDSCD